MSPRRGSAASFFDRVYELVRAIPAGQVCTYGEIARALGVPRGARAVGWALRALRSAEEPGVPWHRVVGAGGRISPRAGAGPLLQRRRLQAEGVRFRNDRVVMLTHRARSRGERARARRKRTEREPNSLRRARGVQGGRGVRPPC